jgi:hydroxypyruvate isomerase
VWKPVPCIEWLFKAEYPDFLARIGAAKAAGLDSVEFHLWRDKPIDGLVTALAQSAVTVSSFCIEPRASLVDPAEHGTVLAATRDAIQIARRLGGARMILASGFTRPGVSEAEQEAEAVKVLREAARLAESSGTHLLLEPVNMVVRGRPMFVQGIERGLDIVEAVNSPALRLLADVYHSAMSAESLADALGARMHWVGHVQVADTEGRHEPGTGTLDWPAVMALLQERGYTGDIGLEYLPTLPAEQSIGYARRTLGL